MKQWKKLLALGLSVCMLCNTPMLTSITEAGTFEYDETKFTLSDGY